MTAPAYLQYLDDYDISVEGVVTRRKPKRGAQAGRVRKQFKNNNGYWYVSVGGKQSISIHRFVAIRHLPNPKGYKFVNHIDGNKNNNHASNLEWCTHKHNIHHAVRLGLNTVTRPRKVANCSGQVFNSLKEAGEAHGVGRSSIHHAIRTNGRSAGKRWRYCD